MSIPAPADIGPDIIDAHPAPVLHTGVTPALAAQHRAVLAAATADNTRRAYRSAVNHYLAWGGGFCRVVEPSTDFSCRA